MGYHLTTIEDGPLGPYLGSQTLYAAADEGAFDSPVSPEMTQLCENDSRIVAIVEASGVDHCLAALRSSSKRGRDTDLLINEIETNYKKGFKIIQ